MEQDPYHVTICFINFHCHLSKNQTGINFTLPDIREFTKVPNFLQLINCLLYAAGSSHTFALPAYISICSTKGTDGGKQLQTNQYGVPMNDFLLARVAVIWAETPKSAMGGKRKN